MKKIFSLWVLLVSFFSGMAQTQVSAPNTVVPYSIAKNYFLRNDIQPAFDNDGKEMDLVFMTTKDELEKTFGYATSMGPKGTPTKIDFTKQFALGIIAKENEYITKVTVKSLVKNDKELVLTYEVETDEKKTGASKDFVLIVVDRKFGAPVKTIKVNKKAVGKLSVEPLENMGNPGQVTFSVKEKTLFYYNTTEKKGLIKLSGKEYTLDKYNFFNHNGTKKKFDGYTLSGAGVTINAPNVQPSKNNEGADCLYGTVPLITIKIDGQVIILKNVKVQDCPNY